MDGFCQVCGVRGGAAENGGTQVGHELELTLGVAGGHGQGHAANLVAAAVQAHTAGEQAVAVSDMQHIFLAAACSHDGTGTAVIPQVHVVLGVESHDTLAGGAGGGVDADTFIQGLASQAMGICLTQVVLAQEGQLVEVIYAFNIINGNTLIFHLLTVVGYIVPHMPQLLHKSFVLQLTKLLVGHGFDFRLIIVSH